MHVWQDPQDSGWFAHSIANFVPAIAESAARRVRPSHCAWTTTVEQVYPDSGRRLTIMRIGTPGAAGRI